MILKLNLEAVANDIVSQLKDIVPVHTGRLKNGIQYRIERTGTDYWIYLIVEDYFVYLKPRTQTPKLPSPAQLAKANPPLPKMNDLGLVRMDQLSNRAQTILNTVDVKKAIIDNIDRDFLIKQIKEILEND